MYWSIGNEFQKVITSVWSSINFKSEAELMGNRVIRKITFTSYISSLPFYISQHFVEAVCVRLAENIKDSCFD